MVDPTEPTDNPEQDMIDMMTSRHARRDLSRPTLDRAEKAMGTASM